MLQSENEEKCKTISFEELLLEAIDEGLSFLGKSAKQLIYFHLEKTFKIKRQDIPSKIEKFTYAIEQIFGTGAKILEINIMKCLFKKVGRTLENYQKKTNLEFIDYVKRIKQAKNDYGQTEMPQSKRKHKQKDKQIVCVRVSQE